MPVHRIKEFDIWQPGYAGATVTIYIAGTQSLASVWTDEALTVSAGNPQTLLSRTINDIEYGKFAAPLYTSSPYELDIDSQDGTGVARPGLSDLDGEDASDATVIPTGGSVASPLDDILGRVLHVEDYGAIGASASTNNTTISAAISAAAALGGGEILLPEGDVTFTSLTLSSGVVLRGRGRGVTTLQSTTASDVVTINGDRAGFRMLTLDGVSLETGSVGVFSKANDETVFDDVDVRRFETGLHYKGGRRADWKKLFLENCVSGAKLHGDIDSGGGNDGDEFRNNNWTGGRVTNCTGVGVELSYVDKKTYHNTIRGVGFDDNTGTAVNINGARFTKLPGCSWSGNTVDLAVDDDSDTDAILENTVIGLHLEAGDMSGGAVTFAGTCQDVLLELMEISDVDFTLTSVTNNIVVRDSIEDSLVTISGDGDKYHRTRSIQGDMPGSSGETADATVTKAWAYRLAPGQVGDIRAVVVGTQRNGADYAFYHIAQGVRRPGSVLSYDAQTEDFVLGDTLTGATSGATGIMVVDTDSGVAGDLTLISISGEFIDNEIITGTTAGSAEADGILVPAAAALLGSITSIQTAVETDATWAAIFAVSGDGEVEVQVTGAVAKTIDWVVHAEIITGG